MTAFRLETVGARFLSLRQSFRDQHSPVACERALKPNNHGFRAQTSALRDTRQDPKFSLGPFVSKPPDRADLVRNS